ncbi:response regulator transcription factor [Furfurilactobacillus rossiae]|uniref:Response regulator n=1 Tax=Furfurilactobacillus rossiae DSM 15814 TaxID=1114972 RepID=A0A0R1RC79_9LACO|nr:response regulator transcription factor [Furfurilactobacillus rossiae]KRL54559.1 response regulator [Furfurilactobacillus rossiae DSM 15814]MCF6166055.1 response regulator transcription factor [Furfurilactobacillus rossiae]QFR67332.1 response regulator [Furfurilactobacillus rossiae]QLE60266.1 DNA-binding response regulator OmpR Rec-wHTH domains [Furfurilactobacillus rossiae]QLE63032.1 DNA-binding response regulator OmpR family Rec-wHTH s [Furfurilactobacillus rossiae]
MKKVLIIEDNQSLDDLLMTALQPHYDVQYVRDGAAGINTARNFGPDVILLDLMLPILSGDSVLKTIRQFSLVPIIVLTAVQDKERTVKLLQSGANDYVTKPFDLDELRARIEVQLRQPEVSPVIHTFADISLNTDTYEVTRANHNITLSGKEFAILKLLIAHPHQVFSKADIYETIWNEPYIGAENTLAVHLSNLRKKINFAELPEYIETVWGIGIRLSN